MGKESGDSVDGGDGKARKPKEREKKRRKKWKSQDFNNDEDYRKGSLITPVGKQMPYANPSWDGTITSTSFYHDGQHQLVENKGSSNQLNEDEEMEFQTFEPSANYHDDQEDDDDEDPNRPSSTIFTPVDQG